MNKLAGHVDGYIGGLWLSIDGDTSDATAYGGAGRLNIPFEQMWNVQFDGNVSAYSGDGSTIAMSGGTVHAYWRDSSSYAFGGFAALEHYDLDSISSMAGTSVSKVSTTWATRHSMVRPVANWLTAAAPSPSWACAAPQPATTVTRISHRRRVLLRKSPVLAAARTQFGTMAMYQFPFKTRASRFMAVMTINTLTPTAVRLVDIHLLTVGLRGTFAAAAWATSRDDADRRRPFRRDDGITAHTGQRAFVLIACSTGSRTQTNPAGSPAGFFFSAPA
ncbi:MAG: hypothetical protein R3D43_01880 [Tepidamorphaceae bacterium]